MTVHSLYIKFYENSTWRGSSLYSISRLEDVINIVWMYDGMERTLISESLYE
jgi:hypothetical protein